MKTVNNRPAIILEWDKEDLGYNVYENKVFDNRKDALDTIKNMDKASMVGTRLRIAVLDYEVDFVQEDAKIIIT